MADQQPTWVRTTTGKTINLNYATSIAANHDPRFYDLKLADGKTAQLSRHVAVNNIPHSRLPSPLPIVIPIVVSDQQSDASWIAEQHRKIK
jgi:hypothetical protein